MWDIFKHTNIHIIGIPEGRERKVVEKKCSKKLWLKISQIFEN